MHNDLFDNLFKFQTIVIDDEEEDDEVQRLIGDGMSKGKVITEDDLIFLEVELPYHEFGGIMDRWIPTNESFKRIKEGKVDACYVLFGNCGNFLVPGTKEKFKKKLKDFIDKLPRREQAGIGISLISDEIIKQIKEKHKKEGDE
jgi:hypothetical protein